MPAMSATPHRDERGEGRLAGKRAVVTGAGRHIGRGTALRFAREGATVAILDVNKEWVEATEEMIASTGARVRSFIADVRDAAAVERAVRDAAQWAGGIDILAHVAGVNKPIPPLEVTEADWDFIIDVNLKGTFLV